MGLLEWLFGQSPEFQNISTMTPQQQSLQNLLLQNLGGTSGMGLEYLQSILSGNPEAFSAFEAPMKTQFERETIPGIAERFAGMGTGGAQDSSAFSQTLGRAGKDLSMELAALKGGLKSDALSQLQGLMSGGLKPSIENVYQPGSYGAVGGFLKGIGQGLGKAGSNYFLS